MIRIRLVPLLAALVISGVAAGLWLSSVTENDVSEGNPLPENRSMQEKLAEFRKAKFPDGSVDICLNNLVQPRASSAAFSSAFEALGRLPVSKAFGMDQLSWRVDGECTMKPPYDPATGEGDGPTLIDGDPAYDAYVFVIPQDVAEELGAIWPSRLTTEEAYQAAPDAQSAATMAVFIGTDEFRDDRITLHLVARAVGLAGALQDGRLNLRNECKASASDEPCGRDYLVIE